LDMPAAFSVSVAPLLLKFVTMFDALSKMQPSCNNYLDETGKCIENSSSPFCKEG
jgi:hypothetical protein